MMFCSRSFPHIYTRHPCSHPPVTRSVNSSHMITIHTLTALSVLTSATSSTIEIQEDEYLSRGMLANFIRIACAVSPENMPDTMPAACGPGGPQYLCEWAKLSEDRFLDLAMETVEESHAYAKRHPRLKTGFAENINSITATGASDGDAADEMIKRYRLMLRNMKECERLL